MTALKNAAVMITRLPIGTAAEIISIKGNRSVWQRLHEVGLHIGDRVRVIRRAPFDGPLLVDCNGHEIALGRSIAANIFVQGLE